MKERVHKKRKELDAAERAMFERARERAAHSAKHNGGVGGSKKKKSKGDSASPADNVVKRPPADKSDERAGGWYWDEVVNEEALVGFVFDPDMLGHRDASAEHPECPERAASIFDSLNSNRILESLYHVPSRLATDEEILKAHTPEYLESIKQYVAEAAAEREA